MDEQNAVLEQSQMVLGLVSKTDALVKFSALNSGADIDPVFQLPVHTWADFGSPTTITVTIVAGDRLNTNSKEG